MLVQTKEITIKPEDVSRIFQSEDYSAAAQQGIFNYSIGFIQNIRLNTKVTFNPCYTLIDVLHARKTFYF